MTRLCIDVELLTGIYEAEGDNEPEWPPSPYRLFAALVSATNGGQEIEGLLKAIEEAEPPVIHAADEEHVCKTMAYKRFVPGVPKPGTTRDKQLEKVWEHQPVWGDRSTIPEVPMVRFEWSNLSVEDDDLEPLKRAVGNIGYLGRPAGVVMVRVAEPNTMPPQGTIRWEPVKQGEEARWLRTPCSGTLKQMRLVHDHYGIAARVHQVHRPQGYAPAVPRWREVRQGPWDRLLCYRLTGDATLSVTDALVIADSVRSAVMSQMEEKGLEPWVFGHQPDGSVDRSRTHVGFMPLADVGHEHARGRVLGIGVALPPDAPSWSMPEQVWIKGNEYKIVSSDSLVRTPWALNWWHWTEPSITWVTATPVTLRVSRKPLDLDAAAEEIAEGIEALGLPTPSEVLVSRAPMLTGTAPAIRYRRKRDKETIERRACHARVRFDMPVRGPLAVGFHRYFGLGLMCPEGWTDGE